MEEKIYYGEFEEEYERASGPFEYHIFIVARSPINMKDLMLTIWSPLIEL
jgi:hypothetical protein